LQFKILEYCLEYFELQTWLRLYSSVSIAKSYGQEGSGSISDKGKRDISLHSIQTGCGAKPVSYAMVTKCFIPQGEAAGA
jgi:hypothetical protein